MTGTSFDVRESCYDSTRPQPNIKPILFRVSSWIVSDARPRHKLFQQVCRVTEAVTKPGGHIRLTAGVLVRASRRLMARLTMLAAVCYKNRSCSARDRRLC